VGFIGFLGIVYLCFVGVWFWASIFFISLYYFWEESGFPPFFFFLYFH
jgi:hypothetical protein